MLDALLKEAETWQTNGVHIVVFDSGEGRELEVDICTTLDAAAVIRPRRKIIKLTS
jgi:hypothetical protein